MGNPQMNCRENAETSREFVFLFFEGRRATKKAAFEELEETA